MFCSARSACVPLVLLILLAFSPSLTLAGGRDQPPPLPGWIHSPRLTDDTPQQHGIILEGSDVVRSSPVIAEIDGNTANGKEVAVGGSDGRLYVYKSNGQRLWSVNVLPYSCTTNPGDFKLNSGPAVGQIFGNGISYIVVGYGTITPSDCDGGVVAYRGTDGALAWRFSLRNWAQKQGYSENLYGVLSSPALADSDGDGRMEIGFGGFDRNVYLLNADGTVRWYYHAADTSWSSPAFVNLDTDPQLELVIGTDISGTTHNGGFVYGFKTKPRTPPRIEYGAPGGYLWRTFFDQSIYSSPVIGDVLASNPGPEIVIGSSCAKTGAKASLGERPGRWIKILRLRDGAVLQTLTTNACLSSSVALGDLDDDGTLEIVATVNSPVYPVQKCSDNKSNITAWKATNPHPVWSTIPADPNQGCNDRWGADIQSPVIADVDGNGSLEVLAANFWSVHVLNGRDGTPLTCQNGKMCGSQKSLYAWKTLKSTPAVGDINGDGVLDVVIGGGHIWNDTHGMLYAWTSLAGNIGPSSLGKQAAYNMPWSIYRGNAQHTGVLSRLKPSSSEISTLLAVEKTQLYRIVFSGTADSATNWTLSRDDPHNLLRLNRTSGTSGAPLDVTIVAPAKAGVYKASIKIDVAGTQVFTIPVTVYTASQVYAVALPLTRR